MGRRGWRTDTLSLLIVCVQAFTNVHTHTHIHIQYTHIHIQYTHIHTHTHTHTHSHSLSLSLSLSRLYILNHFFIFPRVGHLLQDHDSLIGDMFVM